MGKKGELAKEKIMDTAIRLYSIHGYDKTSFQMIAAKLEITHTAPIYHFKNKLGLFAAVINKVFDHVDSIIEGELSDDLPASVKLEKYFQGHLTWAYLFKREADVFALLAYFASISDEFAKIYKDIMDGRRREIAEIVLAGKATGEFKLLESTDLVVQVLIDQLSGVLLARLAGRYDVKPITEVNDQLLVALKIITGGKSREQ